MPSDEQAEEVGEEHHDQHRDRAEELHEDAADAAEDASWTAARSPAGSRRRSTSTTAMAAAPERVDQAREQVGGPGDRVEERAATSRPSNWLLAGLASPRTHQREQPEQQQRRRRRRGSGRRTGAFGPGDVEEDRPARSPLHHQPARQVGEQQPDRQRQQDEAGGHEREDRRTAGTRLNSIMLRISRPSSATPMVATTVVFLVSAIRVLPERGDRAAEGLRQDDPGAAWAGSRARWPGPPRPGPAARC